MSQMLEIWGSCQMNRSNVFQCSLLGELDRNDPKFGSNNKRWYNCTDNSLNAVVKELYTLLMSNNSYAIICGHDVTVAITHKGYKQVVLDLGMSLLTLTTKDKPSVASLRVTLPFGANEVEQYDMEEAL